MNVIDDDDDDDVLIFTQVVEMNIYIYVSKYMIFRTLNMLSFSSILFDIDAIYVFTSLFV